MASRLTLEDWNWVLLMLMQALWGAISPNVGRIVLCREEDAWVLEATLREHSPEDEEEMRDAADETSIYLDDLREVLSPAARAPVSCRVVISTGRLAVVHGQDRRTVFLARQ